MLIPSRKLLLAFFAGFFVCFACVVICAVALKFLVINRLPVYQNIQKVGAMPSIHAPDFSILSAPLDFKIVDKNGAAIDLKKHRGRVIVLNLWATWCGPCMAELPSLGGLAAHYAPDKDVEVLCLSEELPNVIFKNAEAAASGAPMYSMNGDPLPDRFKSEQVIPTTFIIDAHGTIAFKHVGTADWADSSVFKFIDSLKGER